ncbi:MAG TPA: helix-turn-helix transcriptional regulator, partial [Chloroflexota bacterium]|nr:helix-turn-helix transcriptional regulator [Chloroflexota bacterium]
SGAPADLAPAPERNPRWEDTPHRPGDPPLRRLPPELTPNTPGGRAARSLGREVRAWREGRGLTQREFGERLGWAQSAVARLEAGAWAASTGTLVLLASRLGIRIIFDGSAARGEAGAVRIADAAPAAE